MTGRRPTTSSYRLEDDLVSAGNGGAGGDATANGSDAGTRAGAIYVAGGDGGDSGQVKLYCALFNGEITPPSIPFLRQVLGGGVGGEPGESHFVLGAHPVVVFECGEDLPSGAHAADVCVGTTSPTSYASGPKGGDGYLAPADGAGVSAEGYPGVPLYDAGWALAYGGDGGSAEAVTVKIADVRHNIMIATQLGNGGDAEAYGGDRY